MAVVTLKDALTYSHKNRTFIKGQPLTVNDPEEVRYYKNNAHFDVQEPPKAAIPPRRAAPAPVEETPADPEDEEEDEPEEEEMTATGDVSQDELAAAEEAETPAPKAKPAKTKPAYRKGQFKPGGKRA